MIAFEPFKHLAYINGLRDKLDKPLQYSLSDSSAETLSIAQLLALDNSDEFNALTLEYASMVGSERLRLAIANLHQPSTQYPLKPDNIVCFSGVQEALFATFNALLQPNDQVIAFTPNYPSLISLPEQLGAKVDKIPLEFETGWAFDIEKLEQLINPNCKMIVINSPHNPTGAVISQQQAAKLITLADKYGCYIVADEVSVFSSVNQPVHRAWLDYPRSISFAVMSKSFGLPGIRTGWVITQDKALLQRLLEIKGYLSICGSSADDALATIAIEQHDKILTRNNAIISQNYSSVADLVNQSQGKLEWHQPQAGILTLVKTNLDIDVRQLSEQLATNYQTLMLPADLFDIEGNYFRLGLGRKNLDKSLNLLHQLIEQTP